VDTDFDALTNARLAAIVGSSNDAVIGKNLAGIITDWNPAAERLFGYSAEEAIGRHISLIAPPGREHEMTDILARIMLGEKVERFETQRRRRDGQLVDVSLNVSPIFDAAGRVVGASKTAHDITDQKRALAEGRLLAAIVSSSDDAIVSNDLNGIVTSWNAAAERLYGYAPEEVIGRPVSILAIAGHEHDMAGILERIRRGERVEHYETQRRHKDGSAVDISLTVSTIYDGRGRIVGASKIARDIGERRRADRRLKLLLSELDHRAKNVLAVAQAILRLTRADTLPDFISAVEGRIKALARVHAEVAENRWDGADLRRLAESGLEAFARGGGRVRIEGPDIWLSPAAAQVVGVLIHELATNAVKHGALSSRDGLVELRWQSEPSGDLRILWTERDGPLVAPPARRSFGAQVIERSVPNQLGGTAEVRWLPPGLVCEFVVPESHLVKMGRAAKLRTENAELRNGSLAG
jgi:PAS domain S-box-containing protein